MQELGPFAFWPVLGATFAAISLFALYRMTQSVSVPMEATESYLGVIPTASPVAVEAAGVWAAEHAEAEAETDKSL
ncbi:hypothetical protein [Nitrincola sp.]